MFLVPFMKCQIHEMGHSQCSFHETTILFPILLGNIRMSAVVKKYYTVLFWWKGITVLNWVFFSAAFMYGGDSDTDEDIDLPGAEDQRHDDFDFYDWIHLKDVSNCVYFLKAFVRIPAWKY